MILSFVFNGTARTQKNARLLTCLQQRVPLGEYSIRHVFKALFRCVPIALAWRISFMIFAAFGVFVQTAQAAQTTQAAHAVQAEHGKPKIVALAPHLVELLFAIGAGDQIIGTSDFADFPAEAKRIPVVGNYLGLKVEKILTMQPDVVVAWRTGGASAQLIQLEKLGIKVIYSNPKKPQDIADEIRMLGQLSGHQQLAEEVASAYEQLLAQVKQKYRKKAQQSLPITVFYELWPQPLTTVAKGSWNQALLDICQVENAFYAAAAPYPQVNIEQVVQRDVQVIIQPVSQQGDGQALYDWHRWPIIPAVKSKRILAPDADKLHRMTTRMLPELDALCEQIYQG